MQHPRPPSFSWGAFLSHTYFILMHILCSSSGREGKIGKLVVVGLLVAWLLRGDEIMRMMMQKCSCRTRKKLKN
jgi:hypothetical protein